MSKVFPVALHDALLDQLSTGLQAMSLTLNGHQQEALLGYLAILEEWNQRMNLTGHQDPEKMVAYHLLDSLSVLPYLHGKRVLDVGTGAGLPGIPLAIADPDRTYFLLDSRVKRVQFVRHVCWQLEIDNVVVVESRMESFHDEHLFDTIVARAVSSSAQLVEQTTHLIANKGHWVFMKGAVTQEELVAIPLPYEMNSVPVPGVTQERHTIVIDNR